MKYTPKDLYEFIVQFSKQNGLSIRQANIQAVRLTWGMYNQIKHNTPMIVEQVQKDLVKIFFEYIEAKKGKQ